MTKIIQRSVNALIHDPMFIVQAFFWVRALRGKFEILWTFATIGSPKIPLIQLQ